MRHRARCRRPGAFGVSVRDERSRQRDVVLVDQAGPRRPALSRILRVPPGPRSADGARGAVGNRAPHHPSAALRAAASRRPASGLAAAAWALPLRPSRRPQIAAADPEPRPAQRRYRQAAGAGPLHEGLRVFRLRGRRRPPGGAQRARRRRTRRRDPHAHSRGRSASARRALASHGRGHCHGRAQHDFRAGADQCRRPMGARSSWPARSASTPAPTCAWCRARTSSCRSCTTTTAPTSCRTPTAASSSPFPIRTTTR